MLNFPSLDNFFIVLSALFSYGRAYGNAYFGAGVGSVIIGGLGCYGYESTVQSCSHNYNGQYSCSHTEDSGVDCHGKQDFLLFQSHGHFNKI